MHNALFCAICKHISARLLPTEYTYSNGNRNHDHYPKHHVHTHVCTHPLNFDHSYVEHECCVRRYDAPHSGTPVAQVRRKGDPPPLPQTRAHQTPVHAGYDPTLTQRHDVRRVVIEAERRKSERYIKLSLQLIQQKIEFCLHLSTHSWCSVRKVQCGLNRRMINLFPNSVPLSSLPT